MTMYFVVRDDYMGHGYNEYSDIYTKKEDAINELKNMIFKWESREYRIDKTVYGNYERVDYKDRSGNTKMVFKIIEREAR
jgi:hypothetical protein